VKKDEEKSGKENKRGRPQTDPMSQKSTKNQTTYVYTGQLQIFIG